MNAREVGRQLVGLCKEGKWNEAEEKFYSPEIVSMEGDCGDPTQPREFVGIEAIREKGKKFHEMNEIHDMWAEGPFVHDDNRFSAIFGMEITPRVGPMAGQRLKMKEVGVYTVNNGKVVREEFHYGE